MNDGIHLGEAYPLHILMISDVYFPRINGVSTSIQTFRQSLIEKGHQVMLIAPDYPVAWVDDNELLRVPSRYIFLDPEDRLMRSRSLRGLLPRLAEMNFDILHIQTPFSAHYQGVWLSRQLNIPRVESYHTFFEEYLFHYAPFLPRTWLRYAARHFSKSQCNDVDAVIVPSSAMLEVLRAYGITQPISIIPTGIDLKKLSGGEGERFRQQHRIPSDRPMLLSIGRVAFEKNIDFLLRMLCIVVRSVPDTLLLITGEGPALPHLKREVARLGLHNNVRFLGYLQRDGELQDCYRAADALVFASRTETQGLVLLEAMAQGIPVISTAIMGTKDILADGRGAIVAEDNVEDFARKTIALLRDPARHRILSEEGRHYAEEWTAEVMAKKVSTFYEEIISLPTIPGVINYS